MRQTGRETGKIHKVRILHKSLTGRRVKYIKNPVFIQPVLHISIPYTSSKLRGKAVPKKRLMQ